MSHVVGPFSLLLNDNFILLNAEFKDKQLTECTYLRNISIIVYVTAYNEPGGVPGEKLSN
jgi:hypothetical protein